MIKLPNKGSNRRLPLWASLPLVAIELIVLLLLLYWIYLTRPVETYQVPEFIGLDKSSAVASLEEAGMDYVLEFRSSLKTAEGLVIGQQPAPGDEIKVNRMIKLQVSRGAEKIQVPDLRSKNLMEVENILIQLGEQYPLEGEVLNLGNIARVFSDRVENGKVIQQDPEPGVRVFQGSQVDLLIGRGSWPRTVIVPDLRGEPIDQLDRLLEQYGLTAGDKRYVLDRNTAPSLIIEQDPPPGVVATAGQKIGLTVNLSEIDPVVEQTRYTLVRFNPPPVVIEGHLRVQLVDQRGERPLLDSYIQPGERVELLVEYEGAARVLFFWNDELYQIRELGV